MGSTRGLIGDSMAATVSLLAALKYPNIFSKAILQSPYVDEHVLAIVKDSQAQEHISIYHVVGTEENRSTYYG